jgi:hypothetical protein
MFNLFNFYLQRQNYINKYITLKFKLYKNMSVLISKQNLKNCTLLEHFSVYLLDIFNNKVVFDIKIK